LLSMDHLKEEIGLRGYGQKDPLIEYKKESFQIFQDMMDRIEDETIKFLFFMQPYEGHRMAEPGWSDEEETPEFEELEHGGGNGASAEQQRAAQSAFQDFT